MLSETMRKKLTIHFHFRDLNNDGSVERSDWEQCARNLADIRAWEPDSPEYDAILAEHVQIWTTFWQPADRDNDGKVSLDEYLHLADTQRRQGFSALFKHIAHLFGSIFDIIDLDSDSAITLQDYKHYFQALGLDETRAEEAFAHLDLSGDGRLSKEMFIQFGSNFFVSDDPNMPGNWIFGSYE